MHVKKAITYAYMILDTIYAVGLMLGYDNDDMNPEDTLCMAVWLPLVALYLY